MCSFQSVFHQQGKAFNGRLVLALAMNPHGETLIHSLFLSFPLIYAICCCSMCLPADFLASFYSLVSLSSSIFAPHRLDSHLSDFFFRFLCKLQVITSSPFEPTVLAIPVRKRATMPQKVK